MTKSLLDFLPTWKGLTDQEVEFVSLFEPTGGYENILNFLASDELRTQVELVNETIYQWALEDPKVIAVNLERMITVHNKMFRGLPTGVDYSLSKVFNRDQLHLTDSGQAFLISSVVLPALEVDVPPLKEMYMNQRMQRTALKQILGTKSEFLQAKEGGYWVEFLDHRQLKEVNAQRLESSSLPIPDGIESIIDVINKNAKKGSGFPLYIAQSESGKKFALDLTQALFYTKIELTEVEDGQYEGWGYDFWLSAGYFNPPRVNYKFTLKATDKPDVYEVEWRLYPLVDGQSQELVRLSLIDSEISKALENGNFPYVSYSLQLKVQDL